MDAPHSGFVLDPSTCRDMSIEEKRVLVHELSKWPDTALDKLHAWSRRDILEILCAEIGKERKYTGLTKQKMIEYLFKIVSEKKSGGDAAAMKPAPCPPLPHPQTPQKRHRKNDHPSRLPVVVNESVPNGGNEAVTDRIYCQNLACRASLSLEDAFCKRCSCCICHKYDDNKDPSLWLVCSSETLSQGNSCGLSCHLECAFKHERAGIAKSGRCSSLDGSFYCTYCGKVNDLLGCWKKQLMIAKDARRVDVLCYRISLSHKLLESTEKYLSLHETVDSAMKKLEGEVGPVTDLPNMGRGIVNRLSIGAEVQRMCASAIDLLDSLRSKAFSADAHVPQASLTSSSFIKFEGICPTSLALVLNLDDDSASSQEIDGFILWHRKAETREYPQEPTFTLPKPKRRALVTELAPATEYMFKVVAFSSLRTELGMWETGVTTEGITMDDPVVSAPEVNTLGSRCRSPKTNSSGLSNPPSDGDESDYNGTLYTDLNKSPESCFHYFEKPDILHLEKMPDCVDEKLANACTTSGAEVIEPEETPGHSGSALEEEPNSVERNNQASHNPRSEDAPDTSEMVIVPFGRRPDQELPVPVTPGGLEGGKGSGSVRGVRPKPCANLIQSGPADPGRELASCSKKRGRDGCVEACGKGGGTPEGSFEYCVRVVRWLECEGHVDPDFRVKFLTWFSLRATPQERRIVTVYVDTLIDDPASLAGQLVDTFSETIRSRKKPPAGFCAKLWH